MLPGLTSTAVQDCVDEGKQTMLNVEPVPADDSLGKKDGRWPRGRRRAHHALTHPARQSRQRAPLTVGLAAVAAHMRHCDTLGACDDSGEAPTDGGTSEPDAGTTDGGSGATSPRSSSTPTAAARR